MPRRHNEYEDLPEDEFESDFEDPVSALASRIMDRPEVRDAVNSIGSFVESAGSVIDSLGDFAARGGRARPQSRARPRQAPPRVEYRYKTRVVREKAPEDPRLVMGFPPGTALTRPMVKKRQRDLAALYHPDKGGSTEAMQRLNLAAEALLRELG